MLGASPSSLGGPSSAGIFIRGAKGFVLPLLVLGSPLFPIPLVRTCEEIGLAVRSLLEESFGLGTDGFVVPTSFWTLNLVAIVAFGPPSYVYSFSFSMALP